MPSGFYPRARPAVLTEVVCPRCQKTYWMRVAQGYTRKFCSRACASQFHQETRHALPGTDVEIEDLLWRLYWKEWKTTPEIAALYDTDHGVIKAWMRRLGIPRRPVGAVRHLTCTRDGCREPIHRIHHAGNGARYGRLCKAHWNEHRRSLAKHYKSSRYERLTQEERWLRIGKETLITTKKLCRDPWRWATQVSKQPKTSPTS